MKTKLNGLSHISNLLQPGPSEVKCLSYLCLRVIQEYYNQFFP